MKKSFNVTGLCVPEDDYMVDITEKLDKVVEMIEDNKYFTINRARQYGKTTMLFAIYKRLCEKYYVVDMSFEGVGDGYFSSERVFCNAVSEDIAYHLEKNGAAPEILDILTEKFTSEYPFKELSRRITELCKRSDKEIIILIDEVDKSSDSQIFLNFLGMLRNKYLDAKKRFDYTFKSVVLAGVYDIKNLKLKIRPDSEKKYNSPWNVAADFEIDMSFSPKDISTMLSDYEKDNNTGMDIKNISEIIYEQTSGYPYLVSRICKTVDEKIEKDWTENGINKAVKFLLDDNCLLFDDLIKNIDRHKDFSDMTEDIIIRGAKYPFNKNDPATNLGMIFGVFSYINGQLRISNRIFEIYLYDYFIIQKMRKDFRSGAYGERNQFIENGKLDMEKVLLKFQELMKAEYRHEDGKFLEQQGRLLFLCFIKPIINGTGFYYVEPETRDSTRMDIVVTYGAEEHIIELKIWHGEVMRQRAHEQLMDYMENRDADKGYLVIFSCNKNKEYLNEWTEDEKGKRIFEVIV